MPSRRFSEERINLDRSLISRTLATDRLRRAGMLVLALILVLTGSYVRTRSVEEATAADWLILVQLGLSMSGGCLGVLLLRRHPVVGFGAKALGAYVVAVIVSGLFSSYFVITFGYWILLTGTSLLCIGLISSSVTQDSLRDVEGLILATLSFMLLKDSLIDALYFRPQVEKMEEMGIEMYRFGMGSTSSNSMGLVAAIAFWMTFRMPSEHGGSGILKYFWRSLFAVVVVLTRARIALVAVVGTAAIRWWFVHWHSRGVRSHVLLVAVPCLAASAALLLAMTSLLGVPLATDALAFVNRGEDSETMMSVTGRTYIWPHAIDRILEGPVSTIFGHGYGTSKFVLNNNNPNASFFAYHAHNTFLEVTLSTGLLSAIPFVALLVYSLKWLFRFSRVLKAFSLGFALRATTVVSAILSSTLTESELATKLGPVLVVFLFYVLALDRHEAFLTQVSEQP